MTCKRRLLPLLATLLVSMSLDSSCADITTTLLKNLQPSSVTIDEPGARKKVQSSSVSGTTVEQQQKRGRKPPGSPVNLFMPDEFQFYTLNNNGQLVMKQMTKQEIQGMIAVGDNGLPVDVGHQQTKIPESEPKVADVVQNVQKVLKGELSKPVVVYASGSSSIPGSVNSQWSNMLPYILSGGTVEQQAITQDTSMILPTLDDQLDIVPLQNGKPADNSYQSSVNYVASRPTLLGNMALDSGILGEQESSHTTKRRPSRPSQPSTTTYPKFTTTRPTLDDANKNSSKPTLYIPLSVQPSLLAEQQEKNNYDGVDLNKVSIYPIRPNTSTTKKTTTYTYSDNTEFTRLPIISVPVTEVDKFSANSPQKTPGYEILPTISSITASTEGSYASKVNIGPMGGFKKPSTSQRPTTFYRPIYEPITYRPVHEASSRHPVYDPTTRKTVTTKPSTVLLYELNTKPNTRFSDVTEKIVTADTTSYKLAEKTTDKISFTVEPIKVEDESDTTTGVYYTSEKSTQKQTVEVEPTTNEMQYTVNDVETTTKDSYESNNKSEVLSKDSYYVTSQKPFKQTEKTQSWTDGAETTLQFIPIEETTLYQSRETATPTTLKNKYPDSTIKSEVTEKDYEVPTVPSMLSEAISSIIGSIESKPMIYESATYNVPNETTIESKVDLTTESDGKLSTDASKLADTTILETTVTVGTVSTKKKRPVAATTEMYVYKKQPVLEEEEISTVKVIPIYDDDTPIYTLPADSSTKITSLIVNEKIETKSSSTTQSNLVQDTILPGLEETFNNYMKEHYDSNLVTTDKYDGISHMTAFPPMIIEKASSSDKSKKPILSESDSPVTTLYESSELKTTIPTKLEASVIKSSVETPIIFLDISSPAPEKEMTKDHMMNNSALTRIKINNLALEVDKIIVDTPIHTNTPSTVGYTMPDESKPANNIASGIIAGYPSYSQSKPITNYMSSNTETQVSVTQAAKASTDADKIVSYQKVQTTLLPEMTTTYMTSYESFTQIPFESLPIVTKPTTTITTTQQSVNDSLNDSPLEKISDLINQLQNFPADIGYDNSNGIASTIVPLDRFETIMSESNSTSRDQIRTTIVDNISKTSAEPQNSVYVVLQTLPPSKVYQSSAESIVQSTAAMSTTSMKKLTTQRPSTTIAEEETMVTVVQQPVTGSPYIVSTYSTTKSSIEKIQSTIDKSAGRINLEEEKTKAPLIRPTDLSKFTMKNKIHYSTLRRPSIGDLHQTYTRKTTKPIIRTTSTTTMATTGKPIADSNEKWTLIPQKAVLNQSDEVRKVPVKENISPPPPPPQASSLIVTLDHAKGAIGLDQSNKDLDSDVAEFLNICNELSFKFWMLMNTGLSSSRSIMLSPFGMISTLAMIFLGARGLTSNAMNDILKLDDVVTFNPHLVFQNITDAVTLARGQGIDNAAFVRALFTDRLKVRKIMPFYKEQAQQFYEGAVVDINFSAAGDILRRRTNLLIRKQTGGRIKDFVKGHTVSLRSPLTALSANVFQTSCDSPDASSEGRDGEMYFAVAQTVKQRKLVPIPAVVWKSSVSAGYEPSLDATAVALGDPKRPVSLIMVMPGQQGLTAAGDNLERLELRLFGNPSDNALEKLLKVIISRRVELQMPKFSQRSVLNVTSALKRMGFDQLLTKTADLKGINGAGHDLFLAEMIQMNLFCTCGDDNKAGVRHLTETYPGTAPRHTRAWGLLNNNNEQQSIESNECEEEDPSSEVVEALESSDVRQKIQKSRLRWYTSSRRRRCRNKRQAEPQPERPRMKMDKPFLYLIRHNLSGLILHMGRFNPKN